MAAMQSSVSPLAGDRTWMEQGVVPFLQGDVAAAHRGLVEALRQPSNCFLADRAAQKAQLARRFAFVAGCVEAALGQGQSMQRALVDVAKTLASPPPAGVELPGAAGLSASLLREAIRLDPGDLLAYQELCLLLSAHGADPLPIAEAAVRRGLWADAMQRPTVYFSELESRAFWEVGQLGDADAAWIRELEASWQVVVDELCAALEAPRPCFADVGGEHRAGGQHDGEVLGRGSWSEVVLYALNEEESQIAQAHFPRTRGLLRSLVPSAVGMAEAGFGEIIISRLGPHSHIAPHCAPNNARLTAHLGLRVPEGCRIRVGREWRQWEEGKTLLFDDSFEHEVVTTDQERIVLLIRFWHPQCIGRESEYMKRDDRIFNWKNFRKTFPPLPDEDVEKVMFGYDMDDAELCLQCKRPPSEECMPSFYMDKATYRLRASYRCTGG